MRRPTVMQSRLLLLAIGVVVGISQTILAWERGAAPTEVLAPALYIPIFAGAIFLGLAGGLVAAAGSSVVYTLVLVDQSSALGMRLFMALLVNRVFTYVLYGILVAVGVRYIEGRLQKLELYDQVDDTTELYNSSFFLEDSDLEMSRAARYQSIFSVAELRFGPDVFERASRRRHHRVVREFSRVLRRAVRTVDRPVRVDDGGGGDMFLVILPETGREGSAILAGRLEEAARRFLAQQSLVPDGNVSARALTFPDDTDSIEALRGEVAEADARRRVLAPSDAEAR